MSFPEEEEVKDLQQSFVFGSSVVKPQAPHSAHPPSRLLKQRPEEPAEYNATETLCLSRTQLNQVSESILKTSTLKYLYLEGNHISSIPDLLFISLPNLQWLDLRHNLIVSLPAEIGSHRSLKTLLLEGNPITELPPELGNVITLRGLNLRNCPINFPPQDIVDKGVQGILQYLRSAMAKRQVIMKKSPLDLPEMEKLQLTELMWSSIEEPDDDDLQKFNELKHKMIQLDEAELGSLAQGDRNPKSSLLCVTKDKKALTKAGMIPKLHLFDTQHWKTPEERGQAAVKDMNEKQAVLEQRKKSYEALRKWRVQTKITQGKKTSEHKHKKNKRKNNPEEINLKAGVEDSSDTPQKQRSAVPITHCEDTRLACELQQQILACAERIQERRMNPRGTAREQMAAAEQDLEEMTKLQARLLDRSRNRGGNAEKCFTIFTADKWLSFPDK